jgi:hypothetical protein
MAAHPTFSAREWFKSMPYHLEQDRSRLFEG